jgi:hypothetical protein
MKWKRPSVYEVKKFWLCVKRGRKKLVQIREKYIEGNTDEGNRGAIVKKDMIV